jgi:RsiW-degrading membrane proteinase PrsW (M82 family)
MKDLFRLIAVCGLLLIGALAFALGMAQNTGDLLAPLHLLLLVLVVVFYLLPSGLAVYRDCNATIWIVMLDVFLGWTFVGWAVAMGWAASGKTRILPPSIPTYPVPSH